MSTTRRSAASIGVLAIVLVVGACGSSGGGAPSSSSTAPTPDQSPLPSPSSGRSTAGQSPLPSPSASLPADDGARIVNVETIGPRTLDLTIDSPAVGTQKVRILVPAGFEAQPLTRWPVLYLLHGADDSYVSWTRSTDVAALTESTHLLVVMPEGGTDGWYSDWWNDGNGGQPMWETFHLTEVRQLLERNWHAGEKRVIAGLSMGGYGAMAYAARHPGMFLAAASFSGVLDPIEEADFVNPLVWGDSVTQADVWQAHSPLHLASALKGIPLYVSYGNGQQGPLDAAAKPNDPEATIGPENDAFVRRLKQLKIPITVDSYGPGLHAWPYWQRGLHTALPMLLKALGE